MLEPVSRENSPANDQHDDDAPGNRRDGKDQERTNVAAKRAQRECADGTDDDPVDRHAAETLHGAAVYRPTEAGADRDKLDEHAANDREWKQRELFEQI